MHSRKGILSKSWERVTGTCTSPTELLDTRWCHYQTLQVPVALTQKGEKPAPEDENDREKGRNVLRPTSGKHRNSGSRSNMKRSLEICRKIWKTRGCWFRGRMAPHTPPCTATIDGGSTELHPRRPTPPTPPLAPPRTAPPPRQQPQKDTLNSVVLDRATPAPSAAHTSFGAYYR
jgi:hypothetical protein